MARDYVMDEAAARASAFMHLSTTKRKEAEKEQRRRENWRGFASTLRPLCNAESKRLLERAYSDRMDPEVNRALEMAEWLAMAKLFPERLSATLSDEEIHREVEAVEANLLSIYEARNRPEALEERKKAFDDLFDSVTNSAGLVPLAALSDSELERRIAFMGDLIAMDAFIERYGALAQLKQEGRLLNEEAKFRGMPYDAESLNWVPDPQFAEYAFLGSECRVRQTLARELFAFFKKALALQTLDPHGVKLLDGFATSKAGKKSGDVRSTPMKAFQDWALERLKKSKLSRNALAQEYIDDVKRDFKFPKVRAWLTPKNGWNPPIGAHGDKS